MQISFRAAAMAATVFSLAACGSSENSDDTGDNEQVVNVYASRHYDADRDMYAAFEDLTGIKVNLREAGAAQLLETVKAEGENTSADLIITADAGSLWRFQEADLLQPMTSDLLEAAIPEGFREPSGYWHGLSKRYRIIAYAPDRITADQVDDYADLANPALEGELCVRSSTNVYNLSLLGDVMVRLGSEAAESWASGIVGNFARQPSGGDTDQIKAVAAGLCSVAIVNHYYWVRLSQSASDADRDVAEATSLAFPTLNGAGAHVNITGAGVAKHAQNPENALKLLEFLASPKGQEMLVVETKEFPIVDGAALPDGLELLPSFQAGETPLSLYGANQSAAQAMFDRVDWN